MSKLALWLMMVLCLSTAVLAAWPCKHTVGGKTYDFSKIAHLEGSSSGGSSSSSVFLSLCTPLSECNNGAAICTPNTAMGTDTIYGSVRAKPQPTTSKLSGSQDGLSITYSNGSNSCVSKSGDRIPYTTKVNVKCSETKPTSFVMVLNIDQCTSMIDLEHPAGCGSGSGLSGGAIFLIIIFSLWAAYFLFGFLLCKFYFKKTTIQESIPHYSFWTSLPGLYIAGIKFAISKIKGNKSNGLAESEGGYGATEEV